MQNNNYSTKVRMCKVNKIYVKESNVPKPRVKSLTVFFLSLHLFFGIDCGFAGLFKEKAKNILKLYSTLLSIFMFIAILLPYFTLYFLLWYWLTIFECLSYLIVLKTAKYSVFNLIREMQDLHCISTLNESFGIRVSLYSYAMYVSKMSLVLSRCYYSSTSNCHDYEPGFHTLYAMYSNILDFIPISATVIYHLIHCAVLNLGKTFDKDNDVSKFLSLYRAIADCCDKIQPFYDNIVSNIIILI